MILGRALTELLGHRNVANTLIYTQLVEFEGDEYSSAVAHNVDEAEQLIETGFEYISIHDRALREILRFNVNCDMI